MRAAGAATAASHRPPVVAALAVAPCVHLALDREGQSWRQEARHSEKKRGNGAESSVSAALDPAGGQRSSQSLA